MSVSKDNSTVNKKIVTLNTYNGKLINRLILLGNGFDLAHGLKTSYTDFKNWYLSSIVKSFKSENYYIDNLIEIKFQEPFYDLNRSNFYKSDVFCKLLGIENILVLYKNQFFNYLLENHQRELWVDLELEYYEKFKFYCKDIFNEDSKNLHWLYKLNEDFENIGGLLKKYLKENIPPVKERLISGFELFFKEMKESDLLVNFNYTNTIEDYFQFGDRSCFLNNIIKIHGNVNENEIPLVFGFGDERDADYQNIENLNDNSLLDHFKSFAYFRNQNYAKLLSFIDSVSFEVVTIGLSCGLSDRTLLSQIFEHENCKRIRIMYYNGMEGYQEVARNISRHFSNKQELRRKLMNFKECKPFP